MKKLFLIFNSAFLTLTYSYAQPAIEWQKCLGGTFHDNAYSIQQTSDGGYVVASYTDSNNGDVAGNHGQYDYWVVKLDVTGNIQWQKCLGGTNADEASSIQQTSDGGYVVAGVASSNNGNVTGNHGNLDYWIVKLDANGNIQWQKCLGGTGEERARSVQQTSDSGYVVAGYSKSNNGDVTGNHGNFDYWIVKLDVTGTIQWQKCLGGTADDMAYSIQQTSDGGYVVAGCSESINGDVTGNHGNFDSWVVKLDVTGTIQWQKCLGGTLSDYARSIQQTWDGGYVVAGIASSNDGDVTGNHGDEDYWVIKLDANGNIQWQKCFGGTGEDYAHSVRQSYDGGYVVAGYVWSNNGDVTGNHGGNDFWVVKLYVNGNTEWLMCLGGTDDEYAHSIIPTLDGGYIVAGSTDSDNGDVSGNHNDDGSSDVWIVKLSRNVGIEEEANNFSFNISPNPFTTQAIITFNKQIHNATFSLYNLLGEKVAEVLNINGESFQFNRGNLRSGVYVFEVLQKDKCIGRGKAVVY